VDGQDGAAQDHAGDDHAQPAEDDDIVLEVLALHIRDGVAGGQGHGGGLATRMRWIVGGHCYRSLEANLTCFLPESVSEVRFGDLPVFLLMCLQQNKQRCTESQGANCQGTGKLRIGACWMFC